MINFNVTLNERAENTEIKRGSASKETILDFGFKETKDGTLLFFQMLNQETSLSVSIFPDDSVRVEVLDELFLQPYDYQNILHESGYTNKYAKKVHRQVQELMRLLLKAEIVTNYKMGDYL